MSTPLFDIYRLPEDVVKDFPTFRQYLEKIAIEQGVVFHIYDTTGRYK